MKKSVRSRMTEYQASMCDDIRDCYEEYVANERDSWESKKFMLENDDCFYEWAAEKLNIYY